jgi:hypothetical protein
MTGFFYDNIAQAWSYPVKEVAKPSCKADHWSKLSADCKINLPIIAKANYASYRENQLVRLIYSVLWGAPYSDGWDMKKWTHEWVDIVSSEWTPIFAVEDGEVVRARKAAWYGNLVTIKHKLAGGKVAYSIYWHLEWYTVAEWDTVFEWQKIGTMGHEGMARGNHLHFAINTTPDNTYAFLWCGDYPKTWDYEVVEKGLCRDNLFARTVDPIAFIEFNGTIPTATTLTTSKIIGKSIVKNTKRKITPIAPSEDIAPTPATVVATASNTPITPKPVIATPAPVTPKVTSFSSTTNSSDAFLKTWKVSVVSNFGNTLKKWGNSSIGIVIEDASGKKFTWVLDKEVSITPTKNIVWLSPRVIRYVSQWQVISFIEAKEIGTTELVVSYGDVVIGKLVVTVN